MGGPELVRPRSRVPAAAGAPAPSWSGKTSAGRPSRSGAWRAPRRGGGQRPAPGCSRRWGCGSRASCRTTSSSTGPTASCGCGPSWGGSGSPSSGSELAATRRPGSRPDRAGQRGTVGPTYRDQPETAGGPHDGPDALLEVRHGGGGANASSWSLRLRSPSRTMPEHTRDRRTGSWPSAHACATSHRSRAARARSVSARAGQLRAPPRRRPAARRGAGALPGRARAGHPLPAAPPGRRAGSARRSPGGARPATPSAS
jgi:hypothetical protein